jgi:UDP-N-acetylmuramate dehydrogenase
MSDTLPCGIPIERDAPLASFTSWVVGGRADHLLQPRTVAELRECVAWGLLKKLPITILAGGTNVLISDQGVRGLTIGLRKMAGVQVASSVDPSAGVWPGVWPESLTGSDGGTRLRLDCLAGTSKSELLKNFLRHRLEPALFLAGLPGDVGGGVVMNAGVGEMIQPREFVEITDWIEVLRWDEALNPRVGDEVPLMATMEPTSEMIVDLAASFELVRIPASQLTWSYRHCEGWRPGIITRVGISWPLEQKDDILARVKQANQVRLTKQPLDLPSCGSVFVNPPGHKSGQLIERAGLKGHAIGGAKVSEKHANFIVNFDKATAEDIHRVIEHVKERVKDASGVELRTEVVYVGEWPEKP